MRDLIRRLGQAAVGAAILLATAGTARAASALIDFAQGASNPAAGIALIGTTGTSVSVANGGDATGVQSWQVDLLYKPTGSSLTTGTIASSNSGSSASGAFTPDAPGCYRIQVSVWTVTGRPGSSTDYDIREFGIFEPGSNFLAPCYQGSPSRNLAKPPEDNFGGQTFGWAGTGTSADGLLLYQMRTTAAQLPSAAEKAALAGTSGSPSGSNTFVTNADSRNTNARTPTSHASTHQTGGSDPIALDTLSAPTDVTTLNASTSAHGLMKKLSGSATDCYIGTGTFVSCLSGISVGANTILGNNTGVSAAPFGMTVAQTKMLMSYVFSDLGGSASCSQMPALTGGVTSSAGSCATSVGANQVGSSNITDGTVANGDLANMANGTVKCRKTAGTGAPEDCSQSDLLTTIEGASTAGANMLQAASAKAQAALWNAYLPVHGTIGDADTTVNVSTASQYTMATVTANRVVTFGVSGSPVSGIEVMRVDVTRTSAFTVTFKDDAATTLAVCPASVPCSVVVKHDGTHFANPSLVRIQ